MKTPICDFVKNYIDKKALRLHMPGHKGCGPLGFEGMDITEIPDADSLYEADGIIRESEQNASLLFGSDTFYSTEGSSQCIRAMLLLVLQKSGGNRRIAAGRNAHKTFLTAAALLDLSVDWLNEGENYLCCSTTPDYLENHLKGCAERPAAVYVTSPDYLGNILDIKGLAAVCHKFNVPLLVDNAHGAYLRFLNPSMHPMDLGADMCCDSAHKTLPVLTGGAYLHISFGGDPYYKNNAKNALAMFGSTSPSYLILQSLDMANKYLSDYGKRLADFVLSLDEMRRSLESGGYTLVGNEPLKITLNAKRYGYLGEELAENLAKQGIVAEFFDPDFVTLMFTPEIGGAGIKRTLSVLLNITKKDEIKSSPPKIIPTKRAMSIRQAAFSEGETVDVKNAIGRVLAIPTVGCPPAVPIVTCGEVIDQSTAACFEYYKIKKCCVVRLMR